MIRKFNKQFMRDYKHWKKKRKFVPCEQNDEQLKRLIDKCFPLF